MGNPKEIQESYGNPWKSYGKSLVLCQDSLRGAMGGRLRWAACPTPAWPWREPHIGSPLWGGACQGTPGREEKCS